MDYQSQTKQQVELRQILKQNELLYEKRANSIFNSIQALMKGSQQSEIMRKTQLQNASQYIQVRASNVQFQLANRIPNEQEIDQELKQQAWKQNNILQQQINTLRVQIQEIKKSKFEYILSQKLASRKINQYSQIIQSNVLNIKPRSQNQKLDKFDKNPSFNFVYQRGIDKKVQFNRSYKQLIQHYFKRLNQNQENIQRLEKILENKIKDTENTKVRIQMIKNLQRQRQKKTKKANKTRQDCQLMRRIVKAKARQLGQQIQKRVPIEIDNNIVQVQRQKQALMRAYNKLFQLVGNAIQKADLQKVDDYIKQV